MVVIVGVTLGIVFAECGAESGDQLIAFGVRKASSWVRRQVEPRRHLTLANKLGCFVAVILVANPFRDVEVRSALVHVVLHEPRNRGHGAVPRPVGLIAVAILARAGKELTCPRLIPRGLLHHRRVLVLSTIGNQLNRDSRPNGNEERVSSGFHDACPQIEINPIQSGDSQANRVSSNTEEQGG